MCRWSLRETPVPRLLRAAFLLFMALGIPALIMLPFLLSGFVGRR